MKKLLFICVLIATFVFWFDQKRKFYQVENIHFTAWDTWGGKCYITPYKYRGITPPKKDYITIPNRGAVTVFLKMILLSSLVINLIAGNMHMIMSFI